MQFTASVYHIVVKVFLCNVVVNFTTSWNVTFI